MPGLWPKTGAFGGQRTGRHARRVGGTETTSRLISHEKSGETHTDTNAGGGYTRRTEIGLPKINSNRRHSHSLAENPYGRAENDTIISLFPSNRSSF
ncbi:DNA uptake protein and related DNA-binding protein [Anopheles sinensis]|uniref:DNA uptake protein and related DNA-binding protein n=1 Tax=Anopheles sinensis TaxID=74873 RepID=A0A084WBV9_ANOSI|nr:DNA uptake protein and related DNA-binding protein [Anopheles sinensis]